MKFWRETIAVARRLAIELVRRRRSLIFWAVFPAAVLALNATILADRAQLDRGDAYALAAPPTLVGAALFFSCLGGSVATVVSEREQQTLKRLFMSPLGGTAYFCGIVVAHAGIGFGQALLVCFVAALAGATLAGSWLLSVGVVALSIAAYVGVGFVLGTQLARRTEDVNALVATFGVPLLILGGAFLPASLFPDSLLDLARFNPIFHMTEALSGAAGGADWSEVKPHVVFLSLFAIAMTIAGWVSYRRMVAVERRL
ncbi:MAG: ABC transporter permease [Cyanobacteria bacterium J06639_1]